MELFSTLSLLFLPSTYHGFHSAQESSKLHLSEKLPNMTHNLISNTKSESVNGTNAGRKSLAEDKGPDVPAAVPADASSSEDKAPEPSLSSRQTTNKKVVRDKQGLTIIEELNLDDFAYPGRLSSKSSYWTTSA
ncbi:hypothetical protein YC2023_116868 [Brassica napus]